jgi:hypothetical protein
MILEADEIYTWNDGNHLLMLLNGHVLVQQGIVRGRCQSAIATIDVQQWKSSGVIRLSFYGENYVQFETASDMKEANRGTVQIATRGEFRMRAGKGKVFRQERSGEAIIERARAAGVNLPLSTAPLSAGAISPAPSPTVPGTVPSMVVPAGTLPGSTIPAVQTGTPSITPIGAASVGSPIPSVTPVQYGPAGASSVPAPTAMPSAVPGTMPSSVTGPGLVPLPVPVTTPPQQGVRRTLPELPSQTSDIRPVRFDSPASVDVNDSTGDGPSSAKETRTLTDLLPPSATKQKSLQPGFPEAPASPENPSAAMGPPESLPGMGEALPAAPAVVVAPTPAPLLMFDLKPRLGTKFDPEIEEVRESDDPKSKPTGEMIFKVTGGVILTLRNVPRIGELTVEADRAIVWSKNNKDSKQVNDGISSRMPFAGQEVEFYMAGHVVLRAQQNGGKDRTTIEAEELYYDASRNIAIALNSRLELRTDRGNKAIGKLNDPVILAAPELMRLGADTFQVREAQIFSSKLPSDPGLKLYVSEATVSNGARPRTDLFGRQVFDRNNRPVLVKESIVEARNVFAENEGVPFFYTPFLLTDAREPLGPLETILVGGNRVFGFQGGVGLNVYKLFGVQPIEGTKWRVMLDYLSRRGPGIGTNFDYGMNLWEFDEDMDPNSPIPSVNGLVRAFGLHDSGTDILGGNRIIPMFDPPGFRGRLLWRQGLYDLPYGLNVQSQLSFLSDRNFLEQYYKREFDNDVNQSNFVYVKQQEDNFALTGLGQLRTSPWITTTQWAPRVDAYWLGQDLFGRFTSNTQVSLGYGLLRPSNDPPVPLQGVPNPPGFPQAFDPTTTQNSSARLAFLQELALPLDFGPFKIVPYVKGALVEYTNDLEGNETGRVWGGGGVRWSVPLSRLYPEADSELFNVRGLNHKITLGGNYFYARSNEPYNRFAEFDRLNDDASEQMLRELTPFQPTINPNAGFALATSPLYDPQTFAIRRLIDNRIDTLDDIQVIQLDMRQRLQTKRGYPGFEHIVDWMTLDTGISLFPETSQNFGKSFAFLEYQYVWNIGDRTTFESSGWFDPQDNGPRVYTVGMFLNRSDRTSFYVGYRQIDPLQSRMITGAMTYVFSPKYSMTLSASYDVGLSEALTNTLVLTRTGTDLQVSLGFTYNSLQNNFGVVFEIVPNLVPLSRRSGFGVASGSSMFR